MSSAFFRVNSRESKTKKITVRAEVRYAAFELIGCRQNILWKIYLREKERSFVSNIKQIYSN